MLIMRGSNLLAVTLAILLVAGCAASRDNPFCPPNSQEIITSEACTSQNRILWGTWRGIIDPEEMSVEFIPFRTADFTLNLTKLLQPPKSQTHKIFAAIGPGSDPPSGKFVVDITIQHPYPGMNALTCFDVRGIIMGNGTIHGLLDPTVVIGKLNETRILNADGYTRWWNFPEFTSYGIIFGYNPWTILPPMQPTSTVNSYKYFADGIGLTESMGELDTSGRGSFSTTPGINSRRYEIQFNMTTGAPVLDFAFVVDASWALPDIAYQPEYPVEAFPLDANCREPFSIVVTDAGTDAWYKSDQQKGGKIILDIAISDWQGPENQYGAIGEFNQIWVEGPLIANYGGAIDVYYDSEVLSSKDLTAVFRVTLSQLKLTHSGPDFLLISVVSTDPTTYEPQIDGGGSAFSYPDAPLTAYAFVEIEILDDGYMPIWPTFQGNRANTGCIGLYGPKDIHDAPTWTHMWQTEAIGFSQPVFLTPTVAFLCNSGSGQPLPAAAIDLLTQETLWTQEFHFLWDNWLNVKGVSEDGDVVLAFESKYNTIYGLDASDGSKIWQIPGDILIDSYPTTDLDGNFIIPVEDFGYQSVDPHTGTINWTSEIPVGHYDIPAVGENGRIYCTSGSDSSISLYALDHSDGSTIWKSVSLGNTRMNGITVHPDGSIIIHSTEGLWCFRDNDFEEEVLWVQPYPCPYFASPGISPDGYIYILDYDGILRKLDPQSGDTLESSSPWGDGRCFRPAIGADGLIYGSTRIYEVELELDETWINCWNPDCSIRWQYFCGLWSDSSGMMCAPAIGNDGTLYSSYQSLGICAWKDQ